MRRTEHEQALYIKASEYKQIFWKYVQANCQIHYQVIAMILLYTCPGYGHRGIFA